jgi:hypothetical protein
MPSNVDRRQALQQRVNFCLFKAEVVLLMRAIKPEHLAP